jgi:phosphoribosyl 1,2-cyclic phosphodiesterase
MKIHFLGTCSGTEPMPGRHQTSVAVETGASLYLFDAGENCGYTAYLMGLPLENLRSIVISHPDIDHVGGLPHLFFTIEKVRKNHPVSLYTPDEGPYLGAVAMLGTTREKFERRFPLQALRVSDGLLFDDGVMRVTARHNRHLGVPENGVWRSFSYLIECEGKRVVYSGDVVSVEELDGWFGCDALLMETGHHLPEAVAKYLLAQSEKPEKLFYMHHGRTILHDEDNQRALLSSLYKNAFVTKDGETYEI